MDLKIVKAIYRFLKGTDIVELEIEGPEGKVRVRRAVGEEAVQRPAKAPQAPGPAWEKTEKEPLNKDKTKTITSPMVGTFYRAPSPEAPAFVETGSIVKDGQALCIIEAMKIMNEVESEYTGKVIAILVDNGQPVEYGEPLFHLEVQG